MEPKLREMVLNKIRSITKAQAQAFNCQYEIREGIPGAVLVNTPENTQWAANVARKTFGDDQVVLSRSSLYGQRRFCFMLQKKKGTYCMLGNGDSFMVHHPQYVFNQDILPIGAAYWVKSIDRGIPEVKRFVDINSYIILVAVTQIFGSKIISLLAEFCKMGLRRELMFSANS